jgi:hypothetical protein
MPMTSWRGRAVSLVRDRGAAFWLIVVAAAYTALMLLIVAHMPLDSDESLYASQVNPRVPALKFSAPRARGVTYLIAPILHMTGSTVALRVYLALIAGTLLVVAYWPWLRVVDPPWLVPLAALVFASLWVSSFYGANDMPNVWVAFFAVTAVGWFLRYGREHRRRDLIGVALGLAGAALMRPSDAFWIALPLGAVMIVSRTWRRPAVGLAVLGGALAGVAQWVVEAYQHFGGLASRLHQASAIQGGIGWHPKGVFYELRSLAGPQLCRPCAANLHRYTQPSTVAFSLWWLAIPVLVVVALLVARRDRQSAAVAVPIACGASIGLSYLLTVNYAAPRFLLPTYALLALPVAYAIRWLVRRTPSRWRYAAVALVAVALVANFAGQLGVLVRQTDLPTPTASGASALTELGLDAPCVLAGVHRTQVAYRLGCTTGKIVDVVGRPQQVTVAYLSTRPRPPRQLATWRRHRLAHPHGTARWYAYLPPRQSETDVR